MNKILVGLTYDLRDDYLKMGFSKEETAEFDKIDTIEGIENALHFNGYETERIGNVNALMQKLLNGNRWDIVFNICEGLYGIGREAQVPAILDIFKIPYTFSDPMVLSLTLHKAMTKRVVRDLGLNTPDFFVISKIDELIDKMSKVDNFSQLFNTVKGLLEKFNQPVLVEEYLPGREFTVGVVGTGKESIATGLMEVKLVNQENELIYSYDNKENYQGVIDYTVPEKEVKDECEALAVAAWKGLECRDGGRVDIRMDKNGKPAFIEVNPLAGLNPVHSDLPILSRKNGIDYNELIGIIMKSAIMRIK